MRSAALRRAAKAAALATGLVNAALLVGDRVKAGRGPRTLRLRRPEGDRFLVLIFHRVVPDPEPLRIDAVPVGAFDAMMRYLARRFDVLGLDEILDRVATGRGLPRRAVAVTFDDGYEDNVVHALPVLARHGLRATFFLTAGCVERREPLWFDRVLRAFETAPGGPRRVGVLGREVRLEGRDARETLAIECLIALKGLRAEERDARVEALLGEIGAAVPRDLPCQLMTWDQARRLVAEGMTLGSHSMTHPALSTLRDDELRGEIVESKTLIEARTGAPVRLFAYPYGKPEDYSPAAASAVARAGYDAAVSTSIGPNAGRVRRFDLLRVPPMGPDVASLATTLAQIHLRAEEA